MRPADGIGGFKDVLKRVNLPVSKRKQSRQCCAATKISLYSEGWFCLERDLAQRTTQDQDKKVCFVWLGRLDTQLRNPLFFKPLRRLINPDHLIFV